MRNTFNLNDRIVPKCTPQELRCLIRLIKHDLKMGAGPKHVLDAIDPNVKLY